MKKDTDTTSGIISEVELFAELDRLKQTGNNRGISKLQFDVLHRARSHKNGEVALSWRATTNFYNNKFGTTFTEKKLSEKYRDYARMHYIDIYED